MHIHAFPADRRRYSAFLRHAHWLSAALVLVAYVSIYGRQLWERGTPERILAGQIHTLSGLLLLLITVPRLIVRFQETPPPIVPAPPLPQRLMAALAHVALFLYLAVQPLLGMATLMVSGKGIGFPLIAWRIPGLAVPNESLAKAIKELHEFVGVLFIYVIAAHLLAAIWHWRVRQDNALQRML